MEKEILFDLDDTLMDTKKLSRLLYEDISKTTGIDIKEIIRLKDEYKLGLECHTDYYPDDLLAYIHEKTGKRIEPSQNPFNKKSIFKEALYVETIETLRELRGFYNLGTLTEGHNDYQFNKMSFSGIINFIDPKLIYIARRKLSNEVLDRIPDGTTVVDNDREVVKKLHNTNKGKRLNIFLLEKDISESEKVEGIEIIESLTTFAKIIPRGRARNILS
ncbi:MAG: hypothetical protein WDA13_00815 [Candidatus Shapirobacteria bacterium]